MHLLAALHRVLLRCFPGDFRARYDPAMTASLIEAVGCTRRVRGPIAAIRHAFAALADTAAQGVAERAHHRRLAGPVRPIEGVRTMLKDLKLAVRLAARRPVAAVFSVLTFGVGIGAAVTIFSLVDTLLLQPVPYRDPQQIVVFGESTEGQRGGVSYANAADFERESALVPALTIMQAQSVNLTGVDEPDRLRGGFVTSDFFPVVAVPPLHGRPLAPEDDLPNAAGAAVLNHAAWQQRFGGDPGVIGRIVHLNNVPFTIVGVMPEDFRFPVDEVEVWMPAHHYPAGVARGTRAFVGLGRLAPGVTVAQAQAELDRIAARLAETYPDTNAGRGVIVIPMREWLTASIAQPMTLVFGLVIVLLLVAAANVAGLQLGATSARRQEFAVRVALGAGRRRLMLQLLTEHLLLTCAGGAAGVLMASLLLPLAIANAPVALSGLERVGIDFRVLAFALLATAIAALVSGLVPAWHWSRRGPAGALQASRSTADRRLSVMRTVLVGAQVALAAVLLVAGGLLVRSYLAIAAVDPGFTREGVLTLEYRLPRNKYPSEPAQAAFHEEVAARVAAVPGVTKAAIVRALPFSGNGSTVSYSTDPGVDPADGRSMTANTASAEYFAVMGIPIIDGRTFGPTEHANAPLAAVVSRSLAERAWPGARAVGKSIRVSGIPVPVIVIGVAGDVRHSSLEDERLEAGYISNVQNPGIFMTIVARTSGDPMALADEVRHAVWSIDPEQPMWKICTLDSLVARSLAEERFMLGVLGLFAAAALVLALGGLYGVIAQSVALRSREIGVRVALGATQRMILRHVLRSGLLVTSVGVALGLGLGIGVGRTMQSLLYEISALDPMTYAAVGLLLMATAALACYLPARRAGRVDAVEVLRD